MPALQEWSDIKDDVTTLKGGLDQKTPSLSLYAGACQQAENFECSITGGYTRVAGYERFDGHTKPSDGSYEIIAVQAFINTPTVGQTLTGNTSGVTSEIIAVTDAYMVVARADGSYTDGETVKVGATIIGVYEIQTISVSALNQAIYQALAADAYRNQIGQVPGSGKVRGVVSAVLNGVHEVYAWRDNAGATQCKLYKATTSGWSAVTLYNEIDFTAGGASTPSDGDTLTQGANTAVIKRVVLESGTWAGSTAAGRFIVETPAPGNFAAGAATIGAINVTLSGAQTPITFSPGGKFVFDVTNFAGQLTTRRIYGADGVNRCWEFDGTTLVPIRTGAAVDTPKFIQEHHKHLIVAIGSSIMGSGPGLPYQFTALAGGFEIAVGDTVTGMKVQPGNQDKATMLVICENRSGMLYGTGADDFVFIEYRNSTGGIAYMSQNLDQTYLFDDLGLMSLAAAQEYGNFTQSTLTQNIQPFIKEKQALSLCSTINKERSQYRAFFSDGYGLYATIKNHKFIGAMPVKFAHGFNCAWNGELANGNEITYVGSNSNGYVFQLDVGSSCDGDDLSAMLVLAWNFVKTPRYEKRYRGGSLEIQGQHYAAITFGYRLGYNSEEIAQPDDADYSVSLGDTGAWDEVSWDSFSWDGNILSPTEVELCGRAENIQVIIRSGTNYIMPYTINSLILSYSMGRRIR
jgi:hypothetical protein